MKITAKAILVTLVLLAAACAGRATQAQQTIQASSSAKKFYELDVAATKQWMDTKIDLRAGQELHLTATGTINYPADKKHPDGRTLGPEGLARAYVDLIHQYPVTDAGRGTLIGRLGSGDAAQAFSVGASRDYVAPVAGRLFLGINQSQKDAEDATGTFHVKIDMRKAGLSTADAAIVGGPADVVITSITPELLEKIPRRVSDPQGNPGDMVNILIVGTEKQVVNAFTKAGWVHVDKSVEDSVVNAVMDSVQKKDYLAMPMSTLYLFHRPQDYGFAHAEPVRVAMSRNHLRVWKSPYMVDERPLWCVAATHDIGFERDERNNGVTHKIDPAIDGEREYVNNTLTGTGLVAKRTHVTPSTPLTEAKTATGGSFRSDGRILVLMLASGNSTTK